MTGRICGTGFCVPEHVMDNEELSRMVDTSDEWIRERTGIERRRIITEETTVSMASMAAENALEDAGISPEQVDLIITASISSNVILPCTSCEVQKEIGAIRAACFDINAACCGFLTAYQTAQAYIVAGIYRTILVIGSESLSKLADWTDRGTCILFGDGAGAAVLTAGEGRSFRGVLHSDGSKGNALTCSGKFWKTDENDTGFMKMDGREVFQFAVKRVPEVIHEVLDLNDCELDDIDYFIVHQANRRIIESAARRLGVDAEKFPINLQEYGNTSSASIPILLDELRRNGMLRKGNRILLAGFGAGLSWGAGILDWTME
ncbi:MAG: ketoacyl-ACP synthase III [Dorea sp.]|nr:ketoacyl-ACP synthase III [Dorea sp.]